MSINVRKCDCSIIIPVFIKYGVFNFECVNSVLSQTYGGLFEIILVGNDDDIGYVKGYYGDDYRIRYSKCLFPSPGAIRNKGITEARGAHIVFVDCDDILDKDFLLYASKYWDDYEFIAFGFTRDLNMLGNGKSNQEPFILGGNVKNRNIFTLFFCEAFSQVGYFV